MRIIMEATATEDDVNSVGRMDQAAIVDTNTNNYTSNTNQELSTDSEEKDSPATIPVPMPRVLKLQRQQSQSQSINNNSLEVNSMEKPKQGNIVTRYMKKKCEGLTKRQIMIMVVFAFVELFAATVVSIQAPFYPAEAEKKGASATEYGFVFGVFELTVFIMSPVFGTYMSRLGPKRVFNYGIFTTGVCCIIFGVLNHIENGTWFIITSIIVRAVEAVGDAAFVTASFTIIALEFPDSVATTFATMETFYGLGMIIGPTLGGALYEVGGYTFPFALMGSCLFITAIATFYVLPDSESSSEDNEDLVKSSGWDTFKLISIPAIAMIAYSIVATATGVGFLAAHLEPHIRQFGLSGAAVGAIFILHGGVYALTAPLWGWVCDHVSQPKYVTLVGSVFSIFGFLLIGPAPFLPFETILWVTAIGQVLFGLGIGATLVSAFLQALKDAMAHDYPDNISTYGLVSGLWTSMTALGFFIGPSVGGIILDQIGFRWVTIFILVGQLSVIGLIVIFLARLRYNQQQSVSFHKDIESDRKVIEHVTFNPINGLQLPPIINTSELAVNNGAYLATDDEELDRSR